MTMRCGIFAGGVFRGSSGVELPIYINRLYTLEFSSLGGIFRLNRAGIVGGNLV